MKRRIIAAAAALVLLFVMVPASPAVAEEGVYVLPAAPATASLKTGEKYELDLTTVFADSDGHDLTYDMTSETINQHTKVDGSTFYFSVQNAGTYAVTLAATCASHGTVSHTVTFTVTAAGHGLDAQYGYDETPAESVTVYFTCSSDGAPILAEDGTPVAHLELTVPYFDLALYGLEQYYRYHTANGEGPYVDDEVVERPTGLHMYLYVLERYYMGLPEEECGKGTSGVLSYCEDRPVFNIVGEPAYETNGLNAIIPSQSATSLYMSNFWGHDENLMYYRNHVFPYMSPGWGATSDYILLSDGDTWDVALFSNWDFWNDGGAFVRFDQESYTAPAGGTLTVQTSAYGTTFENSAFSPIDAERMMYRFIDENGTLLDETETFVANNRATITVPSEPGEYTLVGIDVNYNSTDARLAPPTAKLTVTAAAPAVLYGDVNGDGAVNVKDARQIVQHVLEKITLTGTAYTAADVNGDGTVNVKDARLIVQYVLEKITQFPAEG